MVDRYGEGARHHVSRADSSKPLITALTAAGHIIAPVDICHLMHTPMRGQLVGKRTCICQIGLLRTVDCTHSCIAIDMWTSEMRGKKKEEARNKTE